MDGSLDLDSFFTSRREPSQLAKDLHVAFARACVTDLGYPYQDAMRDFVGAAMEAYVSGVSVPVINLYLQVESKRTGVAEVDEIFARRPLDAVEVEMRSAWLRIVHSTLELSGVRRGASNAQPAPVLAVEAGDPRMQNFVKQVMRHVCMGYDLQRIKFEQMLKGGVKSNLESAVFSQGMRLVLITLDACGYRCPPNWEQCLEPLPERRE